MRFTKRAHSGVDETIKWILYLALLAVAIIAVRKVISFFAAGYIY